MINYSLVSLGTSFRTMEFGLTFFGVLNAITAWSKSQLVVHSLSLSPFVKGDLFPLHYLSWPPMHYFSVFFRLKRWAPFMEYPFLKLTWNMWWPHTWMIPMFCWRQSMIIFYKPSDCSKSILMLLGSLSSGTNLKHGGCQVSLDLSSRKIFSGTEPPHQ